MRKIGSSSVMAVAFVALLAAPVAAAQSAAPTYVSSSPSNGEELHQAPEQVEVTFNEPLDSSSELTVEDSCGRTVDDGNVSVDTNTISVGISLKPSGHYIATYVAKGIGGLTGETKGSFHFEVHAGSPCGKSGGGHGDHDKNKNGDHDRHRDDNDDDHMDHGDDSSDDHSSTGHDSNGSGTHSGSSHTGGTMDHSDMNDKRHGKKHGTRHGNKHGKGHGKDHSAAENDEPDGSTVASGDGGPFGPPNGLAVLTALGLSLSLGVIGGWYLRVSGGR